MSKRKISLTLIVYLLFGAFGLLSLFLAADFTLARREFIRQAKATDAEIIAFEPQRKVFKPVLRFHPPEADSAIVFVAEVGSRDTTQKGTGDTLPILYYPEEPSKAVVNDFWQLWYSPLMLLVFGFLPLALFALVRLILVPKSKKTEDNQP